MSAFSSNLGSNQEQLATPAELQAIVDIAQGTVIPVPANAGDVVVRVVSPSAYKCLYGIQSDNLPDGPINMVAAQIVQDPESEMLSIALQGLWAHDELGTMPVFTYNWQRNGVDIPGATGTRYMPVAADAGQTLQVVETTTDSNGARSQVSNTLVIAGQSNPFSVTLESAGVLQVSGNDGRSFVLDDPADVYDGTYTVDPVALGAGPVGLVAPVLRTLTTAEAGAILAVTPALFAYDPAHGPVTISYTSNGTNAVDATNPEAPSLLIDVADAGNTLTLTATASQGGVPVGQ
ncbi:MAG: hypothetical protein ABJF60_00005, partial [Roseobacter sp.]